MACDREERAPRQQAHSREIEIETRRRLEEEKRALLPIPSSEEQHSRRGERMKKNGERSGVCRKKTGEKGTAFIQVIRAYVSLWPLTDIL